MLTLGVGETDRTVVEQSLRADAALRHTKLVVEWLEETENLHVQDSLMDVPCYVPQHLHPRLAQRPRHVSAACCMQHTASRVAGEGGIGGLRVCPSVALQADRHAKLTTPMPPPPCPPRGQATWADSLNKMKKQRLGIVDHFHVDRPTITAMDPDAPRRTGLPLTSEDQDDEQRLMDKLFALVRTGNIAKAKDLCRQSGQSWRAATLAGWEYWHDPNRGDDVTTEDTQGNAFRDIFKDACFAMSNDMQNPNVHERALYAALSGNLARLLPVCRKWEDALWAHYRVMLDVGVERKLRMYPNPTRAAPPALPDWYVKQDLDPETIFAALAASPTDAIRDGAQEPYHIVQALVVQDAVPALITQAHAWVSELPASDVQPYYRFLAHLVLFFR